MHQKWECIESLSEYTVVSGLSNLYPLAVGCQTNSGSSDLKFSIFFPKAIKLAKTFVSWSYDSR